MKLEQSAVSTLIPYANNARTHDESQIKQIASSIKAFGFNNPVLIDEENSIIAGHGRVKAAELLGLNEIPTIKLSHLSDAQRKAYILADNRMSLDAGWDVELLNLELTGLDELDFDLSLTGFNNEELLVHLDKVNFDPTSEDNQGNLDELEPKYISCPHCGKEFDTRISK